MATATADTRAKAVDIVFWLSNHILAIATIVAMAMQKKNAASGLVCLCQCAVAFTPFSVMTVRATQTTNFRPGGAKNLQEEFAAYGYPSWFYYVVRVSKASLACVLLSGLLWAPGMLIGAGGILALMIGAVVSHIRVKDPASKSVPSATLGLLCIIMLTAHFLGCTDVLPNSDISVGSEHGLLSVFAMQNGRIGLTFLFIAIFWAMLLQTVEQFKPEEITRGLDIMFWLGNQGLAMAIITAMFINNKSMAAGLVCLCQCAVAFTPFSVMTVRATETTQFRPGGAKNLQEEFAAYGYPSWFYYVVRVSKALLAIVLLVGIVCQKGVMIGPIEVNLLMVGAGGILVLMIGAVASHIKVKDTAKKSVPSSTLGFMCIVMLTAHYLGFTNVTPTSEVSLFSETGIISVFGMKNGRLGLVCAFGAVFAAMVADMVVVEILTREKSSSAKEQPLLA